VGLPTLAVRGLAVPLSRAVRDQYPGISLHILEAMSATLSEWVQVGRIDLAMLYDPKLLNLDGGLKVEPLIVEALHLIGPSTRPFDGGAREGIPFRAVAQYPLVAPGRPHVIRVLIDETAAKHGVKLALYDIDSLPGLLELVRTGYFSILPVFAVNKEVAAGELVSVPIVEPPLSWQISIVSARRGTQSRAILAVKRLLAEVVEHMAQTGEWPGQSGRPEPVGLDDRPRRT
jgi:DNA-binding transcriptional LysR family regulator